MADYVPVICGYKEALCVLGGYAWSTTLRVELKPLPVLLLGSYVWEISSATEDSIYCAIYNILCCCNSSDPRWHTGRDFRRAFKVDCGSMWFLVSFCEVQLNPPTKCHHSRSRFLNHKPFCLMQCTCFLLLLFCSFTVLRGKCISSFSISRSQVFSLYTAVTASVSPAVLDSVWALTQAGALSTTDVRARVRRTPLSDICAHS